MKKTLITLLSLIAISGIVYSQEATDNQKPIDNQPLPKVEKNKPGQRMPMGNFQPRFGQGFGPGPRMQMGNFQPQENFRPQFNQRPGRGFGPGPKNVPGTPNCPMRNFNSKQEQQFGPRHFRGGPRNNYHYFRQFPCQPRQLRNCPVCEKCGKELNVRYYIIIQDK